MTQPQASRSARSSCPGPGSADEQLVESIGVHLGFPTTVAAPLGVLDRLGARRVRGPAPLHRCRRARAGEGGMKAVNLFPQDQRRRVATSGAQAAPTSCSACLPSLLLMVVVLRVHVEQREPAHERRRRRQSRGRSARGAGRRARRLHRLRADQGAARSRPSRSVADDALRLGALHARAVRVMPEGSWIQTTDASVTGERHRRATPSTTTRPRAPPAAAQPEGEPRRLHARPVGRRGDDGPPASSSTASTDVELNESVASSRRDRTRASTTAASSTSSTSP